MRVPSLRREFLLSGEAELVVNAALLSVGMRVMMDSDHGECEEGDNSAG